MSSDNIQRQINFMIEQQARFDSNMAKLDARIGKITEQVQHNTVSIAKLTDALLSLTNIVERHDKQIAGLIERGKEIDARLNALINVVERHVGDAHKH
jgi:uncharacterized coiled-coil protein SlyX